MRPFLTRFLSIAATGAIGLLCIAGLCCDCFVGADGDDAPWLVANNDMQDSGGYVAPPANAVRYCGQIVQADPALPLPNAGEVFFALTSRQLTTNDVDMLDENGARYLGFIGRHAYGFLLRHSADPAQTRTALQAAGAIVGTALSGIEHKLRPDLMALLASGGELPYTLSIVFWEYATAGEVKALLGTDTGEIELPQGDDSPLGEVAGTTVTATPALLRTLAYASAVKSMELDYPCIPANDDSRAVSLATQLDVAPYNLDGTGVLVGLWEAGAIVTTHQGLGGGRITRIETTPLDSDPFSSGHGTHVCGTIMGDGTGSGTTNYRGYAPNCRMVAYTTNSGSNNWVEIRRSRHDNYHKVDNHSYGSVSMATPSTDYNSGAYNFDNDCRDLLLLGAKSAGNQGNGGGYSRYDENTPARNIIAAANVTESGTGLQSSSSTGPSFGGTLLPQVGAVGTNVMSCSLSNGYTNKTGTSMASPGVCGMITLLHQAYMRDHGNRYAPPDLMRGLVLHSASDVSTAGPDYYVGYGMANVKAGADLIIADTASGGKRFIRGSVKENQSVEYTVPVSGTSTLRVSLCWLDVASSTQAALIHDIDLELVEPNGTTIHYPWTLNPSSPSTAAARAVNTHDCFELATVPTPVAGDWKIRVKGTSITSTGALVQGFAVISSHDVNYNHQELVHAATMTTPATLTDNSVTGRNFTFNATLAGNVRAINAFVDIKHGARGDIRITLTAPNGTNTIIEQTDTSFTDEIYGIFPGTRSAASDLANFVGVPITGTWTLNVADTKSSNTGEVRMAVLEIESDTAGGGGPNNAPVISSAIASPSPATEGQTVTLTAAATDADGDSLGYTWTQTAGTPIVTLSNNGVGNPITFTAPQVSTATPLTFQVSVSDGKGGIDTQTVVVTINDTPAGNIAPVISNVVASPSPATEGQLVTLTASATDANGDSLTYTWTQTGGSPVVTLSGGGIGNPVTFTAPQVTAQVQLTFSVTVSDGNGGIVQQSVSVTINDTGAPANNPPVITVQASASPNPIDEAQTGTLTVTATDPDGDPLTYTWTRTAGPATTILNGTQQNAGLTAPVVSQQQLVTFVVTVSDGRGGSTTSQIIVTVNDVPGGPDPTPTKPDEGGGGMCTLVSGTNHAAMAVLLALFMVGCALRTRVRRTGK